MERPPVRKVRTHYGKIRERASLDMGTMAEYRRTQTR